MLQRKISVATTNPLRLGHFLVKSCGKKSDTPFSAMPIYIADSSIDHLSLQTVPEKFVIFYSSVVDGQLWCPVGPVPDHSEAI